MNFERPTEIEGVRRHNVPSCIVDQLNLRMTVPTEVVKY